MAISRQFEYGEWEATGSMGLRPLWFDGADPTDGRGVAHDMLEHFKEAASPSEGECMATGAFLLLRLQNGQVREYEGSPPAMAGDLLSILMDIAEHGYSLPRTLRSKPLADDDAESRLQRAVAHAFDSLGTELTSRGGTEEFVLQQLQELTAARPAVVDWVRRGYRKAQRRYRNMDLFSIGEYLFRNIGKLVDKLVRSEILWPGAKVRVSADPRRMHVWAKVWEPESRRWLDADLYC